jgi:hypothetical protein
VSTPFHLQIIAQRLDEMITNKPNGSLRQAARDLRMNPGVLSRIVRDRRPMTLPAGLQIFARLGLNSDETVQAIESLIVASVMRHLDELLSSSLLEIRPGLAVDKHRLARELCARITEACKSDKDGN